MGAIVGLASLLGLASRHTFSVSIWPANAVLVGTMLRQRSWSSPAGWLGAATGFIAADVLFGRELSLACFFAFANVIGTMTATALLARLHAEDLQLRRTHSVLRILACLLPACLASGLAGAVLVVLEFRGSALQTLTTWPASELVNYLTFLPAMLTLTPHFPPGARKDGSRDAGAAALLVFSCIAAFWFDGPGSVMFPMPALLLCALTYSTQTTALVTMALGAGCLTTLGLGVVNIGQDMSDPSMVLSIRIAVAFLVLVPLTISSAMAVRDDLLAQLRTAADHDGLTGLLNRRAFEQRMDGQLNALSGKGRDGGFALLWLDIDHFKAINDRHGHLAGDEVLRAFASAVRSCCRSTDLAGRVGGEEFALLLSVPNPEAAGQAADRVREAFAERTVTWNGIPIPATVSIGAHYLDSAPGDVLKLVSHLDQALYRAKRNGRNRVEWASSLAA
ncbi:GGDEF domain-containing protein [Novosphingobium sp. M1R2S20]|uniref:diguanylate cyclase n=1 Tax=Novosphingobium rhizovicinum TaxID=3228928 RepID=A0ABV3R812_9SPHN